MNENSDYNAPGKSTRQMAKLRRQVRIMLVLVGVLAAVILLSINLSARNVLISILVLAGLFFLDRIIQRLLDFVKKREGDAIRGAEAEENVGALLDGLKDCVAVHDVVAGNGNIDHLLFRNDGAIFLIETKSHRGKITVQGDELRRDGRLLEKDFIRQVRGNINWLQEFFQAWLSSQPWINAVIVFTNATVPPHCVVRRVVVIHAGYLERWMATIRGNPQTAKELLPQIEKLKAELLKGPVKRPGLEK